MAYSAQIIKDSLAPSGFRLTTMVLTYPRFVHAEFMTHRMFSRNSASSRAIPVERMIRQVQEDPVIPVWWGKAQPGMQAKEEISEEQQREAREQWSYSRVQAIDAVTRLLNLGLHKQIPNRLLEPWSWITVIVTGISAAYENFFALRCHPDAQPELQKIAFMARDAYYGHDPQHVETGFWHCPFVNVDAITDVLYNNEMMAPDEQLRRISVARCARVSYLTHDGRINIEDDLRLFERLKTSGHWSPFEHVAKALDTSEQSGNFTGWLQYRKTWEHECRSYHFMP